MLFVVSCVMAGVSLCLLIWLLARPLAWRDAAGPGPRRRMLAMAWPWLHGVGLALDPFIPSRARDYLQRHIVLAGLDPAWQCRHIAALQCVAACVGMAGCGGMLVVVSLAHPGAGLSLCLAAALLCAWLPLHWLRSQCRQRQARMLREFPFMLDMTILCVEAGLNLHGALQQAAHHGPDGPLRAELRHVLADVRAGMAREQALAEMVLRTDLAPVRAFVTVVDQAGRMGMNLAPLLRAQADQQRAERFLGAEKKAMEAPVKLLFPLVFCIFPCTFIIIAFPVVSRLLEAGF